MTRRLNGNSSDSPIIGYDGSDQASDRGKHGTKPPARLRMGYLKGTVA
jgi:hypothetical protein